MTAQPDMLAVSLCLTPEELHELTDYAQAARQIQWLTENGWLFDVGASGRPKVARSYYEERRGGKIAKKRKVVRTEGLARGAT